MDTICKGITVKGLQLSKFREFFKNTTERTHVETQLVVVSFDTALREWILRSEEVAGSAAVRGWVADARHRDSAYPVFLRKFLLRKKVKKSFLGFLAQLPEKLLAESEENCR